MPRKRPWQLRGGSRKGVARDGTDGLAGKAGTAEQVRAAIEAQAPSKEAEERAVGRLGKGEGKS